MNTIETSEAEAAALATELRRRTAQRDALADACQAMLEAYAPRASETAANSGELSLHSAVRKARAALRRAA